MRKAFVLLAALIVLIGAVPASNQVVDINTLIANQSGNFNWSGSAPTPVPSGSPVPVVNYAQYKTLVANTTASPCPIATATGSTVMNWNMVISCASTHTASLQSEAVSGNYSTIYYTSAYDPKLESFVCHGPFGADGYNGTPITLPAGTVVPGSSTPLTLNLTIGYPGSSNSLSVALKDPSGTQRGSWSISAPSTSLNASYTSSVGGAGAWSWVITQTGGSDGACDPTDGALGGGTQVTWSGSASWYQ